LPYVLNLGIVRSFQGVERKMHDGADAVSESDDVTSHADFKGEEARHNAQVGGRAVEDLER
jgi:hypothetical protein